MVTAIEGEAGRAGGPEAVVYRLRPPRRPVRQRLRQPLRPGADGADVGGGGVAGGGSRQRRWSTGAARSGRMTRSSSFLKEFNNGNDPRVVLLGDSGSGTGARFWPTVPVNVTRSDLQKDTKRPDRDGEAYVGEVIRAEDGGVVRSKRRVDGITTESAPGQHPPSSGAPVRLPPPRNRTVVLAMTLPSMRLRNAKGDTDVPSDAARQGKGSGARQHIRRHWGSGFRDLLDNSSADWAATAMAEKVIDLELASAGVSAEELIHHYRQTQAEDGRAGACRQSGVDDGRLPHRRLLAAAPRRPRGGDGRARRWWTDGGRGTGPLSPPGGLPRHPTPALPVTPSPLACSICNSPAWSHQWIANGTHGLPAAAGRVRRAGNVCDFMGGDCARRRVHTLG